MADDLYGIEDSIQDLEDWEAEEEEFPVFLPDEAETWLAKRFLAIRFTQEEITETEQMFQRQLDVLLAEIQKLEDRRDDQSGSLRRTVRKITGQLVQYHRAAVARTNLEHAARTVQAAENGRDAPKLRLPTTIKGVHGDLRSKGGGAVKVRVEPGKEAEVVAWLKAEKSSQGIRHKPAVEEQWLPDLTKMKSLVSRGDDGKVQGIVSEDGEACPHLTFEESDRSFWLELPDGSKLTDVDLPPVGPGC